LLLLLNKGLTVQIPVLCYQTLRWNILFIRVRSLVHIMPPRYNRSKLNKWQLTPLYVPQLTFRCVTTFLSPSEYSIWINFNIRNVEMVSKMESKARCVPTDQFTCCFEGRGWGNSINAVVSPSTRLPGILPLQGHSKEGRGNPSVLKYRYSGKITASFVDCYK